MVNYKSRNPEKENSVIGGSATGGAFDILEHYKAENDMGGGSLSSVVKDAKKSVSRIGESLMNGGHKETIEHMINDLTPRMFNDIRNHARKIIHGKVSGGDLNMGMINDVANAKHSQHLIDMFHNDYHMSGGSTSGGSFFKDFGRGFMSVINPVAKVATKLAPLAPLLL
tara:strand:- start:426 stop:932 length:507 start_codon:yes stop_codon:yes gene_type:complete